MLSEIIQTQKNRIALFTLYLDISHYVNSNHVTT